MPLMGGGELQMLAGGASKGAGAAGLSLLNPYLAGASFLAGPILSALFPQGFGGQAPYEGVDPSKYEDEIVIDEGEAKGIKSQMINEARKGTLGQVRGIKQVGAAKRLPSGAITSNIAAASNVGEAIPKIETAVDEMRRNSILDFLNVSNRYAGQKFGADTQNILKKSDLNQASLGGLARMIMLWQSGALNPDYLYNNPDNNG